MESGRWEWFEVLILGATERNLNSGCPYQHSEYLKLGLFQEIGLSSSASPVNLCLSSACGELLSFLSSLSRTLSSDGGGVGVGLITFPARALEHPIQGWGQVKAVVPAGVQVRFPKHSEGSQRPCLQVGTSGGGCHMH